MLKSITHKQTALYFSIFIMLGVINASLGPTLPYLAGLTQSSIQAISILFMTRATGYLLGSLSSGRLYKRFTPHHLMFVALLVTSLSIFAIPFSKVLFMLAFMMLMVGYIESLIDIGGNTLLVWVHQDKVGPYMNALHFFFGIGASLAPLLLAFILSLNSNAQDLSSVRWVYFIMACLPLIFALFIRSIPSPQPYQKKDELSHSTSLKSFLWLMTILFSLYAAIEVSFAGWIYSYATQTGLASEKIAAYLTTCFWVAFTLGRLTSIPLASRLAPKNVLTFGFIFALVSLGLMLLMPQSLSVLFVATAFFGYSVAPIFPTLMSFAERRTTIHAGITGMFFTGVSIASMLIPWFIGQIVEPLGYIMVMRVITILLVVALVVFAMLLRYSPQPQTTAPSNTNQA